MASKLSVSVRSFRFNENVIPARNRRPKSADVWMLSTLLLLLPPLIPRLAAHRSVNVPTGAVTLEAQIPSAPRPPCTTEAYPAYPSLGLPPAVTVWSAEALGRDWVPPSCTDWNIPGFSTLVTTVARFHSSSNADGLLQRLGAISALKGLRYWSVTRKRWRILVVDAHAVVLQGDHIRADFTPEELKAGKPLYFEQTDNLSGKATYQMYVVEVSASRVVVEVENVTTIHYLVVPLLRPGDLQSIYFLDRESDDVWRYYSIVRTGAAASRMIGRNESSAINRAVAFYRHLAGIADNREPPAAP